MSSNPLASSIRCAQTVSLGGRPVLAPFTLDIAPGRWIAVLGPSGAGKSTLLRAIAGLLPDRVTPDLRGQVAWMAQTDLLAPWLSLIDNLCLGQRLRGEPADTARAAELLRRVGLAENATALPARLSGGMRQRAALARTLLEDRPLVLMDEPFSALDPANRFKLHELAAELLGHRAVLFVTHDPAEAMSLADSVYILHGQPARLELAAEITAPRPRDPLAPEHVAQLRQVQGLLLQAALAPDPA